MSLFCTNWFIFNRSHDFQIIWHYTVVHDVLCIICIVQFSKSILLVLLLNYVVIPSLNRSVYFQYTSVFRSVSPSPSAKILCNIQFTSSLIFISSVSQLLYNITINFVCQALFLNFQNLFSHLIKNDVFCMCLMYCPSGPYRSDLYIIS